MSPKKLINFRIDSELLEGLEAIRTRDGIPVSEQVRRAIQRVVGFEAWQENRAPAG
jgi:antitoxin component of RelBE/YafQ-DinJ toxin-antitoxin module